MECARYKLTISFNNGSLTNLDVPVVYNFNLVNIVFSVSAIFIPYFLYLALTARQSAMYLSICAWSPFTTPSM
jgi:hypothetical protein